MLRVLEEQEFQRLGSNKSRRIDVRLISATNRDLSQAIAEKGFRTDLYYRLNAVTIAMPPLREIPEDIPLLANHFARDFAARFNRESITVEEEASAPCTLRLAGNVRELANAIRRAVALSKDPRCASTDLPPHIIQEAPPPTNRPAPSGVLLSKRWKKSISSGARHDRRQPSGGRPDSRHPSRYPARKLKVPA